VDRIVLGYSGGLETSEAIAWLKARHAAEIVAVTMDLGQGGVLEEVRDRALAAGAARAHVLDLRDAFATRYILPALKADAVCDSGCPLAASLGRALIVEQLVEIAAIERADVVAHGFSCGGGSPSNIEAMVRSLNPALTVLAPAAESGPAKGQGAGVPWRVHANLWGRSIDTDRPDEGFYRLTKAARDCPREPAYVEIAFERGAPTSINGVAMPLADLIVSLGTIAGAHGVGRMNTLEDRAGGARTRVAHEAPAAVLLHAAHTKLRTLVTARDLDGFWHAVSRQYADMIGNGLWFTPLREVLDACVEKVQESVTGIVRLKMFEGAYL
jgi:argininosuccinate synthase